jgi:hypothetical protein
MYKKKKSKKYNDPNLWNNILLDGKEYTKNKTINYNNLDIDRRYRDNIKPITPSEKDYDELNRRYFDKPELIDYKDNYEPFKWKEALQFAYNNKNNFKNRVSNISNRITRLTEDSFRDRLSNIGDRIDYITRPRLSDRFFNNPLSVNYHDQDDDEEGKHDSASNQELYDSMINKNILPELNRDNQTRKYNTNLEPDHLSYDIPEYGISDINFTPTAYNDVLYDNANRALQDVRLSEYGVPSSSSENIELPSFDFLSEMNL